MIRTYLRSKLAVCRASLWLTAVALVVLTLSPARAEALKKLVVFAEPIPIWDSIWAAAELGYYKAEGLNVQFREFPSGTTALETFKTGAGDLLLGGDMPGLHYWYLNDHNLRLVAVLERDSEGYVATSLSSITKASELKGKTVATRLGSTGQYFLLEYLEKNGLSQNDVKIRNLDTQVMPTALCHGDIAAFFIWQPYGERAKEICGNKVHELSPATGYIDGYSVLETRPSWLKNADNVDKLNRFLQATAKGALAAAKSFDTVAKYMKSAFELTPQSIRSQWDINGLPGNRVVAIDAKFYKDYCQMAAFMRTQKLLSGPLDFDQFVSGTGFKWDPKRFVEPPKPC